MHRLLFIFSLFAAAYSTAQDLSPVKVLHSMESVVSGAIENAGRSVVAIARVPRSGNSGPVGSLKFNLPSSGRPTIEPTDPRFVPNEFATGVVISADGDVLTNYHVLGNPEANDYYVWHRGVGEKAEVKATPAEVQAGDPWTDLAVLRFSGQNLRPISLGDASKVRRGSFVITLGNPFAIARDGQASASFGIVANLQRSAVRRPQKPNSKSTQLAESLHEFGTLIQTDAKLNLGTSGGALLNLKGEMIGLTTSLAAVTGQDSAAGYAIPIDKPMTAIIDQMRAGRTPAFGFLGLEPTDVTGDWRTQGIRGAVVRQVVGGMPASTAGIRSGEIITEVDGLPIDGAMALFREMSRRPARARVSLTVGSGNPLSPSFRTRPVSVTLGKKHLALTKPAYSKIPQPTWRGMVVDHGTALPPERMFGFSRPSVILPVAVTSVQPDSPAWIAGIRPGQFIEAVSGKPVLDPEVFARLVANESGPVELTLSVSGTRSRRLTVLAPQKATTDATQP